MPSDNTPSGQAERLRRRAPLVPLAIILLIVWAALFGDKGVLRMLQARRQKASLEQQVAEKLAVNEQLKKEIQRLQTDRAYIEDVARRELGMVRDGEVVYQFPAAPSGAAADSGRPLP
jgi:cell division protein FtsB/cell division protein DivIC